MPSKPAAPRNWFYRGGRAYARFRPEYPVELAAFLARSAPARDRAVDVGCGNGQLTVQLAACFDEVVGIDPSPDQIANARARAGVRYLCAPAENLPLPDRSASLVTAAQAAHWFDLPAFYAQARRVGREGAVIALVSYGVLQFEESDLGGPFERFYCDEIGRWWPPQRKLVDNGYRDMSFPFAEFEAPTLSIRLSWNLDEFLGYVSTWSAVQHLLEAGHEEVLQAFIREISALWGEPASRRPITWPISMRVGRT